MDCKIENQCLKPNGPYGDVVLRGICTTHGFRTYGEALNWAVCPIGQIEEATAKALAQIAGTAQLFFGKTGQEPARDDPPALTTTPDPNPNTHTVSQRPRRKPKPTEE